VEGLRMKIREAKILIRLLDLITKQEVASYTVFLHQQIHIAISQGILSKAYLWNELLRRTMIEKDEEMGKKILSWLKYFTQLIIALHNCSDSKVEI
jgi:hypothetical protein